MNVNVKISISDEDRNLMFRRLTGKDTKGMVSRADVNAWVMEQLERFLRLGSPTTAQIEEIDVEEMMSTAEYSDEDISEVLKQNKLLQRRVNILQHALDTRK